MASTPGTSQIGTFRKYTEFLQKRDNRTLVHLPMPESVRSVQFGLTSFHVYSPPCPVLGIGTEWIF
jgi:hypothetical protein